MVGRLRDQGGITAGTGMSLGVALVAAGIVLLAMARFPQHLEGREGPGDFHRRSAGPARAQDRPPRLRQPTVDTKKTTHPKTGGLLSQLAPMDYLPLAFWASALAAAVLDAVLVRPSRRTLLAAVAALELVCFEFVAITSCPLTGSCCSNPENYRELSCPGLLRGT